MNQHHGDVFLWRTVLCYCRQVGIKFWRPSAVLILVKWDSEIWALLATCKISSNKQPTEKCLCVYCFFGEITQIFFKTNETQGKLNSEPQGLEFLYNFPIFSAFGTPSLATTDIRYLT